ncbi:MAG: 30S ribosomal protein S3 [Patescibacteria group bacterium]|nr:30S ribosomal protein S3 [Patescibacteria group bacterium]MDD4304614.1 30S ribosomal protein S3 [Patescibacteria group bacterium]MDD4695541.1 30S ribosomal protein S3 [Patescibacteria group bacterium]
MGHKVNPIAFRMGMSQKWRSKWFSDKNYIEYLRQDILMRGFLKKKLRDASVASIEIKRSSDVIEIVIHSARPGIIIGRGGTGIEDLKKELIKKFIKKEKSNLRISIEEVSRPSLSAAIVLQSIIDQTEKRIPFRKVIKRTIEKSMEDGCKGIKITMSGRLNGVEIARTETLKEGRLPLHTLRADIDYSRGAAATTYGKVGVKVWIYRGDASNTENIEAEKDTKENKRNFGKFNNRRDNSYQKNNKK